MRLIPFLSSLCLALLLVILPASFAAGKQDDLEAELSAAIAKDEGPGSGIDNVMTDVSGLGISLIADAGWAFFTTEDRVRLGGHAFRENGPMLQSVEFAAFANVDPYFRFDLAHSFTHGHVEEAVISTTSLPVVKFRMGQYKTDLGRYNPTHMHTWNFVDQPLAIEWLFGGEGMALPGAEVSLLFPLPWYVELVGSSQAGQVVSMDASEITQGDDLIYSSRLKQYVDLHANWGLLFSGNFATGPSSMGGEKNRTFMYGGDCYLKYRPLGFGKTGHFSLAWTLEGWWRQMEVPDDLWEDATGYGEMAVGITRRWSAALRYDIWGRMNGNKPNDENDRGNYGLTSDRYNGSVSFAPSHFSRLRLNYSLHRITDEPAKEEYEDNHMVAFQLEVAVGTHGAHPF
jgi:hypothetical protein